MLFRTLTAPCRFLVLLALACAAPISASAAIPPVGDSPFAVALAAPPASDPRDPATGNRLAIVSGGYDALLLRIHLIRHAKTSIAIQTFIWTNDECGRLMIYELIEAARRGVRVRILADHMFSDQDPDTVAFLATVHPNFELKHYRPAMSRLKPSLYHTIFSAIRSFRDTNQRMHNKVMLIDGALLLTGGRNIENTYFDHSTGMNFRDRDVLVAGPAVRAASASFDEFWNYRHAVESRELRDVHKAIEQGTFKRYPTRHYYEFGPHFTTLDREASEGALIRERFVARLQPVRRATFISDEPGKSKNSAATARITQALRETLERARTSVVMQTPYLVLSNPAQNLVRAMQAKNPGLQIHISTNSFASTDNLLAYSANYRLRNRYVEDLKLLVHEFKPHPASLETLFPRYSAMRALAEKAKLERPPFLCLHAKSLVVDDATAFVGSYNLDPRSENLNTEVGLLIEDERFAAELRAEIERDMRPENSWAIARRPLPLRLDVVNGLVDGILSIAPIDVWPIQNTSSYELRPGATPVPAGHPAFYENYREVGSFPGTEGLLSQKEILTRLYKAVGSPLTPVL
ncbi:MAG: phospholipase D family protein [Verrucomicrobiota bacterium]